MALEFTKGTDQKHEIKLDSSVIAANWVENRVVAGSPAEVEVRTAFVGGGAAIEITARTEGGEDGGTLTDTIRYNNYRGTITLSEKLPIGALIYFEVKLTGSGGVTGKSNSVPVMLPPKITKLKWSKSEAGRGDILVLSASVRDVPVRTPCSIDIFEYDEDGAHDLITTLTGEVLEDKLEVRWLYEYTEDTDEIPGKGELDPYGKQYRHPEYFFVVDIYGFRAGQKQESGILRFKDFVEFKFEGTPTEASKYEVALVLPDGTEKTAEFDDNGFARFKDVPPGQCKLELREKKS